MIGATDQRTTSGPADPILRVKGRRHDRTHDQRNAEKPLISGRHPDMAALARIAVRLEADAVGAPSAEAVRKGDVQEPIRKRG
jgi:hypothetical protein